jgi:hypothetical protein
VVEYLHLPDEGDDKTGLDDFLAAGHTVTDLMALVKPSPPDHGSRTATKPTDATANNPVTCNLADVAPVALHEGTEIDVADLLDRDRHVLATHVVFPSSEVSAALALRVVHTYALSAWASSPRPVIVCPEPQSGKTRTPEFLDMLTDRPVFASNASVPC